VVLVSGRQDGYVPRHSARVLKAGPEAGADPANPVAGEVRTGAGAG
jgi:hypothetical protein